MNLALSGIGKTFGGVTALTAVDLAIPAGSCHGLMGENGAGKSTLGRILAGIVQPDAGQVVLDGSACTFRSPAEALSAGVAMVHQELAFCPDLSVAENLCLGRWPTRRGLVDRSGMRARAMGLLARIGVDLDVDQPMHRLSVAQEQLVQIAAAVGTGADLLVFDEPTSSLSQPEAGRLFTLIEELREQGLTCLYISHRLPEVLRLCDRVTVLRDGRVRATLERREVDTDTIVRLMIGRDLAAQTPVHLDTEPGDVRLGLSRLSSPGRFHDVSLQVRAGEIVGLAGLVGAGRSELLQAIFGLDGACSGQVQVDGRSLPLHSVRAAMQAGLSLIPEDRRRQGLVGSLSGRENWSLASLERRKRGPFLDRRAEGRAAREAFVRFDIRAPSVEAPVDALSGGNQQKVVLAKWLARSSPVLLVDEPTRGVDVGAKAAIHDVLAGLAQRGVAILLVSSDLPELLRLSSRIVVLRAGRVEGELPRDRATAEAVLRQMAGVPNEAA